MSHTPQQLQDGDTQILRLGRRRRRLRRRLMYVHYILFVHSTKTFFRYRLPRRHAYILTLGKSFKLNPY